MTKCLMVALAMSVIGALGALLFLAFASFDYFNWWHAWNITFTPDESPPGITDGQVVAAVYLCLTVIVQMNILSTRNTSIWFWWSKSSAPPPSWKLWIPVVLFLIGSTFISVYWPTRVKPDGGRGYMDGCGWEAIMLTWFYSLLWFQAADIAKAGLQKVFKMHTEHVLAHKEHGKPMPGWCKIIDGPEHLFSQITAQMQACCVPKSIKANEEPTGKDEQPSDLRIISETKPTSVDINRHGETVVSFTESRRNSRVKLDRESFRNHRAYGSSGHLAN